MVRTLRRRKKLQITVSLNYNVVPVVTILPPICGQRRGTWTCVSHPVYRHRKQDIGPGREMPRRPSADIAWNNALYCGFQKRAQNCNSEDIRSDSLEITMCKEVSSDITAIIRRRIYCELHNHGH